MKSQISNLKFPIADRRSKIENRKSKISNRRGFSLMEMFVAAVLFGTVVATFLPLMNGVSQTQKATDRQRIALREANNLLEAIAQQPWADLTPEKLGELKLPNQAKSFLPDSALKIDVAEQAEPVVSKRVAVQISWLPKPGRPLESVRLVAWFPKQEAKP